MKLLFITENDLCNDDYELFEWTVMKITCHFVSIFLYCDSIEKTIKHNCIQQMHKIKWIAN